MLKKKQTISAANKGTKIHKFYFSVLISVLSQSLKSGRLECVNSGQSSPCLDLSRLNKSLVETMAEKQVDLIVLEGMGRAIHTNLYAKFKCESLKVAVLKNRWLAERLGGEMFSVVFKYEKPV
jgi:type II pantothenate kinase